MAHLVKNPPAVRETWVGSLGWEDLLEKGKAPLQYSGLEKSMDCMVHGVLKSRTQQSDCHSLEHQGGPWKHIFSLLIYLAMPALGCSMQDLCCGLPAL